MRVRSMLMVSLIAVICGACTYGQEEISLDDLERSTDLTQDIVIQTTVPVLGIILDPTIPAKDDGKQSTASMTITTSAGDWVIDTVRLVDEVRGTKAGADQTFLLILFKSPDGGAIKMEDFASARQEVETGIKGKGDDLHICTMGGILESGETALGCIVPLSLKNYEFYWGDNPIIELVVPGS